MILLCSAGRAFTPSLITQMVSQGVQIMPLQLHTGVASLESHEPPFAERFHLPQATANAVNAARAAGRRVIAVGTSAVRVLETQSDEAGRALSMARVWGSAFDIAVMGGVCREARAPQRGPLPARFQRACPLPS